MTEASGQSRAARRIQWDLVFVGLAAFAYFCFVAKWRIVDDDEGFYALAGRAMLEGEVPYRDFFLPQMPLPSFLYGLWQKAFGPGLVSLRVLGAWLAAATALLVHLAARRVAGLGAGLVAVVLFLGHLTVWEWAVTIKTFPVALLFPFAAIVVATAERSSAKTALAAGVLAGLGAAGRLLVWPVIGCVWLAYAWRREPRAARLRAAGAAAAGFVLALIPVLVLALLDPSSFWFDNVGYHAIRAPGAGWVKDFEQKAHVLSQLFLSPLGARRYDSTGVQTTAIVACAIVAVLRPGVVPRRYRAYLAMALVLGGVSFLPSPVYEQYFALIVAPSAVLAGALIGRLSPFRRSVGIVATAAYVAAAAPAFHERLLAPSPLYRPAAFDRVGELLDEVTVPGQPVAAHFPAYLVASHRPILPEAMSQFSRLYSDRLSAGERRRYHLYTESEFRQALLEGRAGAFVIGQLVVPKTALALRDAGWQRASDLPGVSIWVRPDRGHP